MKLYGQGVIGTEAERAGMVPFAAGQWFFATDTKRFYVVDYAGTGWEEEFGDFYQIAGADLYPNAQDAGVQQRIDAYLAWDEHFPGTALGGVWGWAGGVFGGAPGTVAVQRSNLEATPAGATRHFLQQGAAPGGSTYRGIQTKCILHTLTVSHAIGLRIDDGTDNNYVETVAVLTVAAPGTWRFDLRYRTGGGAVNTINGNTFTYPPCAINMQMQLSNTFWTNWDVTFLVTGAHDIGGLAGVWQTNANPAGLAWTPSRMGLLIDATAGAPASWNTWIFDAFDEPYA